MEKKNGLSVFSINGYYIYSIICEWTPTGEKSICGDAYEKDEEAISFLEKERNCIMNGYVGIPQNGDKNKYYIKPLFIKNKKGVNNENK